MPAKRCVSRAPRSRRRPIYMCSPDWIAVRVSALVGSQAELLFELHRRGTSPEWGGTRTSGSHKVEAFKHFSTLWKELLWALHNAAEVAPVMAPVAAAAVELTAPNTKGDHLLYLCSTTVHPHVRVRFSSCLQHCGLPSPTCDPQVLVFTTRTTHPPTTGQPSELNPNPNPRDPSAGPTCASPIPASPKWSLSRAR